MRACDASEGVPKNEGELRIAVWHMLYEAGLYSVRLQLGGRITIRIEVRIGVMMRSHAGLLIGH